MTASERVIIDLVVPVCNESDRMVKHVEEMIQAVSQAGYRPHIILVDDGSSDNTWLVIQSLSNRYSEVKGVRLSRNYGKDSALFAGLHFTCGEATITIDSDGQHPIQLIQAILQAWREGAMIVNTVKEKRHGESLCVRIRAWAFNYLMSKLMRLNQAGTSDYKLLDKQIIEILCQHETSNAIYRFSVANLGFPCANIPMNTLPADRPTRWKYSGLLQIAIRAVMFHTDIPLRAFVYMMLLMLALSLGLMTIMLVAYVNGTVPTGYSTLLMLNLITLCTMVMGLTGLAVYLKGTVDILAKRSSTIVWQQTSTK